MDSTVKARPNHYELLGLAPTASSEEIAQAFAREVSRPREFGGLARIGIAFETLRNPDKRRTYDASIGLAPEPAATPAPRPYAAHAMVATPHLRAEPVTAPRAEPRTAAFIAASLRPPEKAPSPATEPEAQPQSDLLRRMEAVASPTYPTRVRAEPPPSPVELEPAPDAEDRPIAWQRPAGVAAGLIVAVGLMGALIGLDAGGDAQSAEPAPATTRAVPPARVASRPAPSAEPTFAALDVAPARRPHAVGAVRRAEPTRPRAPSGLADLQLDPPVPGASAAPAPPVEQAAAETVAPAVVEASMPLPNATIARTIGRIGYACGRVASTSAIEGEGAGVFKVTCTSGHSYKAAPVRGRYHFHRLSN